MKYILVKRNHQNDSFKELNKEILDKDYKNSILNHIKNHSEWNECDAIAYTGSQYYGVVVDCLEVDDKESTLLAIKYSEIIYKVIDEELEDDLFEKMKILADMTKKLRELSSALNSLQSAESDLYNIFTEISDSEPHVYEFSDLSTDDYIDEYSMSNERIKEVFEEFFD
jgi:hypothetical protein